MFDESDTELGGAVGDVVRLRLPAAGAYLSVLRTVTAGLAARMDFTLEEIDDVRIAVDEACAMLLPGAVPGAELACEFELTGDDFRITVSVPTTTGTEPARDTFAWTVLTALAGSVSSHAEAGGMVCIELHKRRAEARVG